MLGECLPTVVFPSLYMRSDKILRHISVFTIEITNADPACGVSRELGRFQKWVSKIESRHVVVPKSVFMVR